MVSIRVSNRAYTSLARNAHDGGIPLVTLREWLIRLWRTIRPGRRDADIEEELRLHLEMATDHELPRANSREDARRAAVIRIGGITQGLEAARDQRGLPWLTDLARDLRYGLRALRRNPMFASVAVLTLALGIGANTAIFSLAEAVLLRTLPVTNPRELVVLRQIGPNGDIFPFTSAAAVRSRRQPRRVVGTRCGFVRGSIRTSA